MANASFGVNILPKNNTVTIGNSDSPWTIVSPSLTGTPTAPTPAAGDDSTKIATTAFVGTAIDNIPEIYSEIIEFELDNVSNVSGSYSHTSTVTGATANMKAVGITVGNSEAFLDDVTITFGNGTITLQCDNVVGSSTVTVAAFVVEELSFDPAITSAEYIQLNSVKLDKATFNNWRPSNNGTNDQILRSNGDGTTRWDSPATTTEINTAVTSWLNTNVPTGTTVVIDRSLTQDNCAANSKTVGDELSELKSALNDDFYYMIGDTSNLMNGVTYTEGKAIAENGSISDNVDFHYTSLIPVEGNTSYTLIWYRPSYGTGYIRVHDYNSSEAWLSQLTRTNDSSAGKHILQFTTSANAAYIRISAKTGGAMQLMILTSESVIDMIKNTIKAINAIAHCTNILPLMGKETTVASVQRTYKNGHISQSGTASSNITGGRFYPITDNFELDAGTYYLWCYPDAIGTYLLCKANGDVVGYSNGTAITVADQGEYYIAYSGYTKNTVYSEDTYIQLEKTAKTEFHLPSDTFGIDLKAREGVATNATNIATNEHGIIVLNDNTDSFLSTYRIILGEIASNTGAINPSELNYARRTGLIKTKPGDVWSYYGRGDYQVAAAAYYKDGTFVSYESTAHSIERKTFTIPSGCNGVVFSSYNTADFDVVPKSPMTSASTDRLYIPNWSSKKWCAIGDSITAKYGSPYSDEKQYWAYIKEETGINFINCATSGMGYKNGEDAQHLNAFYQKASVERYPDLADADIITVFGSVNDCAWGYTLGNVTDSTTDTVCGCINKTIDNLYVCNYAAVIGIITPGPTTNRYPGKANEYMTDYCEKIVEICNRRSIPCLDLYHNSGCHPWDETFKEEMYINNGDGIHPNGRGHKIIYPRIREFMKTLIAK